MRKLPRDRSGIIGAIIAIIVVVIIIMIVLALIIIPFRSVQVNEVRTADLGTGVESLDFNLTIDTGSVEVSFVDDATTAVSMSVTGSQRSGLLGSNQPVNVSWSEDSTGSSLSVSSTVNLGGNQGGFATNNINCTVLISKQLRTGLSITNNLGSVDVRTDEGVDLSSVMIKTSTGGSKLTMVSNSTLSGPLSMDASLGGIDLTWTDVVVTEDATIDLRASTGGVRATIFQSEPLMNNVSVTTSTNLGGVDLTMHISGENSARVVSHANLGGVNVAEQTGFNGTSAELTSQNYPADSNFEVTCDTSTGGVNLSVRYTG